MNAMTLPLCLGISLLLALAAGGQVVPTTPRKFATRAVGSGAVSSATVSQGSGSTTAGAATARPEAVVRTTTYIVLSGARQWTSSDGKPLLAKLIAFEDVTTESTAGAASSLNPQPPIAGKPTVIQNGLIRLMSGQKPYEVPLTKLSQADQEFIGTVKRAVEATK